MARKRWDTVRVALYRVGSEVDQWNRQTRLKSWNCGQRTRNRTKTNNNQTDWIEHDELGSSLAWKRLRDRKTHSLRLPLVISFERFHVLLLRKGWKCVGKYSTKSCRSFKSRICINDAAAFFLCFDFSIFLFRRFFLWRYPLTAAISCQCHRFCTSFLHFNCQVTILRAVMTFTLGLHLFILLFFFSSSFVNRNF